jgi:hypothetical protein
MRTLCPVLIALCAPLACDQGEPGLPATRDLGTGLNTVEREYSRIPADVVAAAARALPALEVRIESQMHDALGGQLQGRRATGDAVTVTVKGALPGTSAVTVRVDPGDRNLANLVHDRIARELEEKEPARP